jgi:multidrug resistance efflux pump
LNRADEPFVIGQMDVTRHDHVQRRRQRLLQAGMLAGALLVVGALAWRWLDPGVPRIAADRLWIDTVQSGDFERSVRGTGVLAPKVQRWLTAQSGATVERVVAQPGTRVKADDIVLEMGNPELLDLLANAQAGLASAASDEASKRLTLEGQVMDLESSLATLRADHGFSKLQAEREAQLVEPKLISGLQYMQTQQRLEALTEQLRIGERRLAGLRLNVGEQVRAGKARIEQLRTVVAQRERQVDALHVRAGIDGVVQSIEATEGKQVASGAPLGLVVQTSPLQARISVPEAQAKDLVPGMKALVDLRSATFAGHVARIAPGVQDAAVEVLVEPDAALPREARPALAVTGTIRIDRIPGVLTIQRPPEARPESTGSLYRIGSGDRAERVTVHYGRASSDRIEVTGGLAKGDRVVLSNLADWNNPAAFRVQ